MPSRRVAAARCSCTISARSTKPGNCCNCDNCLNPKPTEDATESMITVLKALSEIGDKFKADHLVNLLTGKKTALIKSYNHHKTTSSQ